MYTKILTCLACIFLMQPLSGQTLLKDIEGIGDGDSSPKNWSAVTDELFIFQAVNVLESQFLFASDGTDAGTIGLGSYQVDTDIVRLGDRAYFGGCNILFSADSCAALYVSDGTPAGTTLFFDLVPGSVSLGIEDIVAGDSLFYFSGHTVETGFELWRSNGTASGTYRITDLAPGPESGYVRELAVIDDVAYFAGFTTEFGVEPWRSDGTEEGTYMIADLNDGTANGLPAYFTASGGFIYFTGLGTGTGFEVRRTTGAQGNIALIGEMGTTDSSGPRGFVDSDGILYYAAEGNDVAGYDLFVYDHVGEPLHLEFDDGDIFPRALLPFGDGEVIFNAVDADGGRELWRSDGTLAGTHRIIDLYPGDMDGVFGTGAAGESFHVCHDSLVYFAGADGVNAAGEFVYELFVSDGTAEGTHLVSDHFPGTAGSDPGGFFEFGERIYFAATDPVVGREPFYLDIGTVSAVADPHSNILFAQSPFPNPLPRGGDLTLELELVHSTDLYVQLVDIMGRVVQNGKELGNFPAGAHTIQIKVNDKLPSGLYQVAVFGNKGQTGFLVVLE